MPTEGNMTKDSPKFHGDMEFDEYIEYLDKCKQHPQMLVEISSVCNFKCFYCNSVNSTRKGFMSDDVFYRILEQASDITSQPLRLHLDGEPMLHKKFFEYGKAINSNGHSIELASNGSLLKTDYVDLDMGVHINLSTSPEELARRTSISFEKYINTLVSYLKAWCRSDSRQCLNFNVYLTRAERTSKQLGEEKLSFVKEFLAKAEIPEDINIESDTPFVFVYRKDNNAVLRVNRSVVVSGGLYPDSENIQFDSGIDPAFGFCDSPWKRIAILASGQVVYCCIDLYGSLAYTEPEEIFHKSLRQLWLEDERIESVRSRIMNGQIDHSTCRKCLDRLPYRELYTGYQPPFRPFETWGHNTVFDELPGPHTDLLKFPDSTP